MRNRESPAMVEFRLIRGAALILGTLLLAWCAAAAVADESGPTAGVTATGTLPHGVPRP